ncbi:hypothetical protein ACFQ3B_01190 [Stackebrandtia endophytica]|uniref:hypothetical protein n=1 Tax=Stackebrandtia endophytica TaxID=1496996 RepID=UPI0011515A03|nr:hypothetical protein [Stackebrandtia endophytica]
MNQQGHVDVLRFVEVVAPAGRDRRIVVDWGRIHRELGLRFPSDFRELMERFPSMLLQDLVEVWHPNEDLDSDGVVESVPPAPGTAVAANSIQLDGHHLEWTP